MKLRETARSFDIMLWRLWLMLAYVMYGVACPVLHRIVRNEHETNMFMQAVPRKEGLCEVVGHVVINGRCVGRYAKMNWSSVDA
jgi:hypothetical protein